MSEKNFSKKKKQKILFLTSYNEVLKTFIPLLDSLDKIYDVYVITEYLPLGSDKKNNKVLFKKINGELIKSFELLEQPQNRIGIGAKSRWYRLLQIFIKGAFYEIRASKKAKQVVNQIRPDLFINSGDGRTLAKHIIKYCDEKKIKSICYQWTLGIISKKMVTEYKLNSYSFQKKKFLKKLENKIFSYAFKFVNKFNGLILTLMNKKTKLNLKTKNNFTVFGQGNSTKLALIGKSSRKFYIDMKTNPKKIEVLGHPLYEEIYNNVSSIKKRLKKIQIHKKLSLPKNAKIILWAFADSKSKYSKFYNDEFMFASFKEKLITILNTNSDIYVIFKIHPNHDKIFDYKKLEKISSRIKVVDNTDLLEILSFSSILMVRNSMSAIYANIFNIPTISFNYPPIGMDNFYKYLGGTFHVQNNQELKKIIQKLLNKNHYMMNLFKKKRNTFLTKNLNINPINKKYNENISIRNFKKLINKLL